ncbi:MAG: D-alanyl-D-alanine carboxypeptidase family protein [Candidatus Gracilibacteria bacterium]|nr:D-alanyl-D-alanine carboxypeptidase family protein [Candidatus Gracilibacteria bacterium]MDD5179014.1 D-alanyl-D-alanine carboxypeptidase family protein [Candidatus Gracilibacteria bacterium]
MENPKAITQQQTSVENIAEKKEAAENLFRVGRKAIRLLSIPNSESFVSFEDLHTGLGNIPSSKVGEAEKLASKELIIFLKCYRREIKTIFDLAYGFRRSTRISATEKPSWIAVDTKGKLLPLEMATAWKNLKSKYQKKYPEAPLTIASAYRSPAYQLYLLCYHGFEKQQSLAEIFRIIAPPYHSAHNENPPAIDIADFFSRDPTQAANMMQSEDWNHFVGLAADFRFHLNYPAGPNAINGGLGEPWEFCFRP